MRSPLPDGTQLRSGEYTIQTCLGVGGFGITYRAMDHTLDRLVAIKEFFPDQCIRHLETITPSGGWNAEQFAHFRKRFIDEGKALAKLAHSGIVTIYSVFEEHGTAYLVMAFVDGMTLDTYQRQCDGRLPVAEAVQITCKVGEALQAVHALGLLHRDVKPQNIIRRQSGEVVLIDFGAARDFHSDSAHSQTAIFTPGYAPLEQYGRQGNRGPHTDVYALSATCYCLLTGQPPIDAISRAAGAELPAPAALRSDIPQQISEVIIRALAVKPEERLPNIEGFLQQLKPPTPAPAAQPPAQPAIVAAPRRLAPGEQYPAPSAERLSELGIELVTIPAGNFMYGERKEQKYLPTYSIMKYPVTVAQYRLYCQATSSAMPLAPRWGWQETCPIVCISLLDAVAFARWIGLTLPTEEAWEKAARGMDGWIYPWCDQWDAEKCCNSVKCYAKQTAPVGSFPSGASPYGVQDMSGNVHEWCESWYDERKRERVLRGGCWSYEHAVDFRATSRDRRDSLLGGNANGFRCVLRLPEP